MADLERILKDVLLGSVGAVATVVEKSGEVAQTLVEKGGEIAQSLVEKGRETVKENRQTTEELKRKWQEACPCGKEKDIDLSALTPEQREALRRQLDLMEQEERGEDAADEQAQDSGDEGNG